MVIIRFFELIRWRNLIILLFTQWFVFFFLNKYECFYFHLPLNLLLVNFATLTIAAAGYLINDYFDLKIDVINKPDQIIIEKFISRRWVLFWHTILNLSGILAGLYISPYFGLMNFLLTILLWLYSAYFKKTFLAGNVLVAFMMAAALPVVIFAGMPLISNWLLFYSVFAFFTGIIREIIKDVEDVEGDARYNSQTIPVLFGFFKSKLVVLFLCLFTLGLLVIACGYLYLRNFILLPSYLILLIALPVIYFLIQLKGLHHKKQFRWASQYLKGIMILGILSMLFRCL